MPRKFWSTKHWGKQLVLTAISIGLTYRDTEIHFLGQVYTTHSIAMAAWDLLRTSEMIPRIVNQAKRGIEKIKRAPKTKQKVR